MIKRQLFVPRSFDRSAIATLFVVAVVTHGGVTACTRPDPGESFQTQKVAVWKLIDAFAEEHGAIVPWTREDTTTDASRFFSVDVQRELLGDEETIAFLATLWDVWSEDSLYYAAFTESAWPYTDPPPYVVFELRAIPSLLASLLDERGGGYSDEHLVIAQIQHVVRPRVGMRAIGVPGDFVEVTIEPEFPSVFVATGDLLSFRFAPGGLRLMVDEQ